MTISTMNFILGIIAVLVVPLIAYVSKAFFRRLSCIDKRLTNLEHNGIAVNTKLNYISSALKLPDNPLQEL